MYMYLNILERNDVTWQHFFKKKNFFYETNARIVYFLVLNHMSNIVDVVLIVHK